MDRYVLEREELQVIVKAANLYVKRLKRLDAHIMASSFEQLVRQATRLHVEDCSACLSARG